MEGRPENFALVLRRTLFVGMRPTVRPKPPAYGYDGGEYYPSGGRRIDDGPGDYSYDDSLEWVGMNLDRYGRDINVLILFVSAHMGGEDDEDDNDGGGGGPERADGYDRFWGRLEAYINEGSRPIPLLLVEPTAGETWELIKNTVGGKIWRIACLFGANIALQS